ncbi:TIGR02611 family protein [Mycolicibacterium tusciae]|uniref:TIGR02611 family protein n=1 Tax=Mycolicibacterium tusciae TaxID=75922 RepID=UPI00024A26D1|nr:TIGR02611 family protein [Mycolicibacterium tusciae]
MTSDDEERPSRARRWARWRDKLRDRRKVDFVYRIAVGVVGLGVLVVGIVAIPYPGPGWAIVFVGLGILATEFEWARRLLGYAKERYEKVMDWFQARHWSIQVVGGIITALIVTGTLWLLGAADWTAELFGFDWSWLNSPIGLGS